MSLIMILNSIKFSNKINRIQPISAATRNKIQHSNTIINRLLHNNKCLEIIIIQLQILKIMNSYHITDNRQRANRRREAISLRISFNKYINQKNKCLSIMIIMWVPGTALFLKLFKHSLIGLRSMILNIISPMIIRSALRPFVKSLSFRSILVRGHLQVGKNHHQQTTLTTSSTNPVNLASLAKQGTSNAAKAHKA